MITRVQRGAYRPGDLSYLLIHILLLFRDYQADKNRLPFYFMKFSFFFTTNAPFLFVLFLSAVFFRFYSASALLVFFMSVYSTQTETKRQVIQASRLPGSGRFCFFLAVR